MFCLLKPNQYNHCLPSVPGDKQHVSKAEELHDIKQEITCILNYNKIQQYVRDNTGVEIQ